MEDWGTSAVDALIRGSPMAVALYALGRVALSAASSAWASWLARFDKGTAAVERLAGAVEKLNEKPE